MARTCLLRWAICQASMRQRGDGAHDELVFEPPDDLEPVLQRFVVERAMGACARLLRDVLGSGLELAGCTLRYGAPPPGAAPARLLGARVRYHAQDNVLRLAHAHLLQPLPQANAVTAAMCERLCAQLLQRMTEVSMGWNILSRHCLDFRPMGPERPRPTSPIWLKNGLPWTGTDKLMP